MLTQIANERDEIKYELALTNLAVTNFITGKYSSTIVEMIKKILLYSNHY